MGVAPMSRCDELALGLESLLELDGEIIVLEQGFWVKIDARRVERSTEIPQ